MESAACIPTPINRRGFNPNAQLPYGLTTTHIAKAMESFTSFLEVVNVALHAKKLERLEYIIMPANFSSIVGEFVGAAIPKFNPKLMRNRFPNGHPDLIPSGHFPEDKIKVGDQGIEVKGSQRKRGWQGHNPEDTWLMVFVFDSNKPVDKLAEAPPKPFKFEMVVGAKILKEDWKFSGRSATSRRTITASVTKSGYEKMMANWIYRDNLD